MRSYPALLVALLLGIGGLALPFDASAKKPDQCSDAALTDLRYTLAAARAADRPRLLVSTLTEDCGERLGEGLVAWLQRWKGGPDTPGDLIARTAFAEERAGACRGKRVLWGGTISPGWEDQLQSIMRWCRLEKLGLSAPDSFYESSGPESALLGSLVYARLVRMGRDEELSRRVGAWIAGLPQPGEPVVSRGFFGEIGYEVESIELARTRARRTLHLGDCTPLVAVGSHVVSVDGSYVGIEELSETLESCRPEAGGDGRLVIGADALAPFSTVSAVLASGAAAGLDDIELIGLSSAGPASEYDRVRVFAVSLYSAPADGEPGDLPALTLRVADGGIDLRWRGEHRATLGLLDAAGLQRKVLGLKGEGPGEERVLVSVGADVEWADLLAVLDAVRQKRAEPGESSGRAGRLFPTVLLVAD